MNPRICLLSVCLLVLLGGCASNSSNVTPPPTPPPTPPVTPSISITAPLNGSTVITQPVSLSVSVSNGADPTKLVVLLDGVDITTQFGAADSNGTRTAKVSRPDINYGKNQIQARYDSSKADSSFVLNTATTVGTLPADSTSDYSTSQLVPIRTRILKPGASGLHATDWGIQVGGDMYYSNVPRTNGGACNTSGGSQCNQGFQILLLNRNTLQPINNGNISYEIDASADLQGSGFFNQLLALQGGIPGCQPAGCVMVMQSLARIGYSICYEDSTNCSDGSQTYMQYRTILEAIGASYSLLYAEDEDADVGYSFLGNFGGGGMPAVTGANYERLGCALNKSNCTSSIGLQFNPQGNTQSASDVSQFGVISGAFIRDNYNSFTFAPTAPVLHYAFGTTQGGGKFTNVVRIDGSTTEGAGQYTVTQTGGGFRLLILDRTNPASAPIEDSFYDMGHIPDLTNDINAHASIANDLFFLASLGDVQHNIAADIHSSPTTSLPPTPQQWEDLCGAISSIGGDAQTVRLLGFTAPGMDSHSNPDNPWDDYLLVGTANLQSVAPDVPPNYGAESGYVITRHTVANSTSPTKVAGILTRDKQGYYFPRLQGADTGVVTPQATALLSASMLSPTPWPFMTTQGQQNAYVWLSKELCCSDIRASYINLNIDPTVWLVGMNQLVYPQDQSTNFSTDDFYDVRSQLATEFGYVSVIRNLQTNILGLYQGQQSNVGLILQQAELDVQSNLYTDTAPPPIVQAISWSTFTSDVLPTLANLAGFIPGGGAAVKTALGIATLAINSAVDHTNSSSGASQSAVALSNQSLVASQVAQHAVDEYTESLLTLGNDFSRILSDWGRLKAIGGPLATDQLQWDPTASGIFLRAFNLTTRRQFYPKLMASKQDADTGYFIAHLLYVDNKYYGSDDHYNWSHSNDEDCGTEDFHDAQENGGFYEGVDFRGTAWYPSDILPANVPNTGYYAFDVWALGIAPHTNAECPNPLLTGTKLPSTFGMFDPVDKNNPNGLGIWKPYFFERSGLLLKARKNPNYPSY